jgi:hypothetical protein
VGGASTRAEEPEDPAGASVILEERVEPAAWTLPAAEAHRLVPPPGKIVDDAAVATPHPAGASPS